MKTLTGGLTEENSDKQPEQKYLHIRFHDIQVLEVLVAEGKYALLF
ncbi:hypothetical protein [uncultured Amphritea sp.]|nr:hypothetical protein [uncultured Amphritea sp.]